MRITRVYTRTGDDGSTRLGGGQRVPKDSLRVRAYGTVDELNSAIGVALALPGGLCERLTHFLPAIQNELFDLGSDLCYVEEDIDKYNPPQIEARHIEHLEMLIDELTKAAGPLEKFVLPGGAGGVAHLHVSRAICRRAEREAIALSRVEGVGEFALQYLNRLADALFVMARYENKMRGIAEPQWNERA
ncbi:MAG: cob(I)yrinic acid a,c-diamide adenosyltransferase [Chloroflexi bacterium]|nr:cob(I)yrinic acid a,c-diamide adenosyltransferase [Chloroflexota bacterium]